MTNYTATAWDHFDRYTYTDIINICGTFENTATRKLKPKKIDDNFMITRESVIE